MSPTKHLRDNPHHHHFAKRIPSSTTLVVFSVLVWQTILNLFLWRARVTDGDKIILPVGDRPPAPAEQVPSLPSATKNLQDLTRIFEQAKTDKFTRHHYERYYSQWLPRNLPQIQLLEIGADYGASLESWAQYFTDPHRIVGLAYGDRAKTVVTREFSCAIVEIVWGDQSSPETMQTLCQKGNWDVIIDDGSHVPDHQVYSFAKLFPCLKPGGIYIVEDLETNYWDQHPSIYGYTFAKPGIGASPRVSAMEKFLQLPHVLNRHTICFEDLAVLPGADHDICSIEFGSNLVKFTKCTTEQATHPSQCRKKFRYGKERIRQWMKEAQATNVAY